ncbi:MAG TPA: cysteine desulfurase [Candidatus Bathyarchaeia archaeon]|nr:cysteine desulfurase [Candidatus Bathyarchaeia archaeon]
MLDPRRIREDFPIFKRKINDNPLIYFDNAATTQKPRQVIEAISEFYENHNANIHRAVHTLSLEATDMYETARERIAKFINAKDSAEIIFVRSTTEAINLVAYSWGLRNLKRGDEVLVSLMEHHSNIVPWEIISKINGFTIKYAKVNPDGTLNYEDFEGKFTNKTKIACLSHVSNVSGVINSVKRIAKVAHEHDALMLVDGAQSVPHMPIDVRDLDADFLAFSGHKMLGPTGIGVLYAKKTLLEKMDPFQGGGEMIKEVSFSGAKEQCDISLNDPPWKFEAGTPNICGAIALSEAVKYLQRIGMDQVQGHECFLTNYAIKRMQECSKVTLHGPTDTALKCGIIPFSVQGLSSHDVALFCDNYGIMIRSGFHCAQPLHQVFKLQSSARASFYIYNTREEIDRFIEVLKEIEKL